MNKENQNIPPDTTSKRSPDKQGWEEQFDEWEYLNGIRLIKDFEDRRLVKSFISQAIQQAREEGYQQAMIQKVSEEASQQEHLCVDEGFVRQQAKEEERERILNYIRVELKNKSYSYGKYVADDVEHFLALKE